MWRWIKLIFRYRKVILTIIEPMLKWFKEQDWTPDDFDDRIDHAMVLAKKLRAILAKLGY